MHCLLGSVHLLDQTENIFLILKGVLLKNKRLGLNISKNKRMCSDGEVYIELNTKMIAIHCFGHDLLNKVKSMKNTFETEGKM